MIKDYFHEILLHNIPFIIINKYTMYTVEILK